MLTSFLIFQIIYIFMVHDNNIESVHTFYKSRLLQGCTLPLEGGGGGGWLLLILQRKRCVLRCMFKVEMGVGA